MTFLLAALGFVVLLIYLFGVALVWFEETELFGATNWGAVRSGLAWPWHAVQGYFASRT